MKHHVQPSTTAARLRNVVHPVAMLQIGVGTTLFCYTKLSVLLEILHSENSSYQPVPGDIQPTAYSLTAPPAPQSSDR